jgi:hypothetical protein
MSAERWGALPLGELHPSDRCALCGADAAYGNYRPGQVAVRLTNLAVTQSHALVCVDTVACERRRYKAKL